MTKDSQSYNLFSEDQSGFNLTSFPSDISQTTGPAPKAGA